MNFSSCQNIEQVLKEFLKERDLPQLQTCNYCNKQAVTFKYLVKDTSRTTKDICKQCYSENSMWLEGLK